MRPLEGHLLSSGPLQQPSLTLGWGGNVSRSGERGKQTGRGGGSGAWGAIWSWAASGHGFH